MKRQFAAALALLVLLACAHCFGATPLPPAPAQGYCYDSTDFFGFNGVRACANQPPPPNDPGAYISLAVTWLTHGDRQAHLIDVTQCQNVWGRIDFTAPIQPWPYAGGTEVSWQKTSTKYLRCRVHMPLNPGLLSHFFKKDGTYSTVPVRMALVAPGMPWPTGPATPCWVPLAVNNAVAININPGPPNSSKCPLSAGADADLLIDSAGDARGKIAISTN